MNTLQNNKIKTFCVLIILISILLKIIIITKPFFTQFDETLNLTNYSSYYTSKENYNILFSGSKNCLEKNKNFEKSKTINLPFINFVCNSISLNSNTVANSLFLYSIKMSFNVNYAPINFIFANLFLDKYEKFNKKLFKSRIPFFALSIFSLIFLLKFFFNQINQKEVILLLISLASFSHMINSYELLSIPWGISSLASVTLIYLIALPREELLKTKLIIFTLLLNIIFFYFNWALLFLSLSFYFIIIYFYKRKKILISFFTYLISIIPGFLIILHKEEISRNDFLQIELNHEILFNILERLYFIFISNFHPINSIFETRVYLILLFIIFLLSFIIFFKKIFNEENKISTFCLLCIVVYLIVNILGKFPFKASRHTIFLYPQFLVILGFGLNHLFHHIKFKKTLKFLLVSLASIHFLIFLINFKNFVNQYKTLQNQENYDFIKTYVNKNNIENIFTDRMNILWIEDIESSFHIENDIEKKFLNLKDVKKNNLVILSNYDSNSYYSNIKNKYNLKIIREIPGKNIDIITDNVYKNYLVSNVPKYENNLIIFKILNEKTTATNTSNK